jgi:large subunit ribosomal protein L7Ae
VQGPKGKKPAPAPSAIKPKTEPKSAGNPLFEKKAKIFGIGQSLPPRAPLNRYVKWPKVGGCHKLNPADILA